MGGEINEQILQTTRAKSNPDMKKGQQGWRTLRRLKDQGKVTFQNEELSKPVTVNKRVDNKPMDRSSQNESKMAYRPVSIKRPDVSVAENKKKFTEMNKGQERMPPRRAEKPQGKLNPAFSMDDEVKQATRGAVSSRVKGFETNAFQDRSRIENKQKYEVVKRPKSKSPITDRYNPMQSETVPKLQPPPSRLKLDMDAPLSDQAIPRPLSRSRSPPSSVPPMSPVKVSHTPTNLSPRAASPSPRAPPSPQRAASPTPKAASPAKSANSSAIPGVEKATNVSNLGAGWI